jgi:putative ABC transport system permease protein
MFKNYLKIALRNLRKNKLYAFVNITGLAIGIASCILIGLYIWDELSFDQFHKNKERIARITWEYYFDNKVNKVALTGTKAGPQFRRDFPEVEAFVRTMKYPRVVGYRDQLFDEKNFFYADSAFFTTFSFPLITGDRAKVLDGPDKLVITESAARKYFGTANPVGQSVKVGVKDFQVTGVAADVPGNSQIQFDFVASFTSLNASKTEKWTEANYVTYLLLRNSNDFKKLQSGIDNFSRTVLKKEMNLEGKAYTKYILEPLTSVHLHSDLEGFEPNGNILYIYVLGAVAILLLLIACVNYTNLSTAQSAGRSGEVGIRKVLGAAGRQIFYQFISESFMLVLLSIALAIGLTAALLPYFNELAGKHFHFAVIWRPEMVFSLLVTGVIVAFLAGAYPAVVLSGGRITNILKSGFRFTGSNTLRKSLIVFQFVISIFLIIATIVILQQLSYVQTKDLGYDKEQIVVLPVDNVISQKYDDIKNALAMNTNIKSIGGAYEAPTHVGWSDGLSAGSEWNDNAHISINAMPVDEDFIKTMDLKIIAGSDYNETDVQQFDTSEGGKNLHYKYILNESAAKALGWKPEEAIGKIVTKSNSGPVKAVVKDFHFRSFHEAIGPMVIFMDKRMVGSMFVKVSGNIPAAISWMQKTWKERITHRPFEYHFLDEDYNALYKTEQKAAGVFTAFASIAIILACLGLFALTAYAMVQRTKEIGIRKILGATIGNILTLVSKDFVLLVFVAFIIAAPITWYVANKWLGSFVYRISIQWWVFVLAGLVTLLIAFLTISMQAIRTAMTNPVKNLRTE